MRERLCRIPATDCVAAARLMRGGGGAASASPWWVWCALEPCWFVGWCKRGELGYYLYNLRVGFKLF